jgi:sulfur transfer protein SufE
VLNDEFLLKSNGDEVLNDVFLKKLTAMKRLTLRRNRGDEAMIRLTMLKN